MREIKLHDVWRYSGVDYLVEWNEEKSEFYFKNPHKNATADDHISIQHIGEGEIIEKEIA